ncbi:MAG: 4a-hydroxytetrahydrobiopterin dehydratase [Anaerolineales bacterium]|uniref:4a-hydroxytetrahydrobiopterin dehydratase n=1 Tax=Candidatus Desulfolinea nitratireducens TaxID=2841698 RepID=A0A8J6TEJ6_9CHLR|nr:4a-hydroxytetrahydrobiopterin dehydratase [Candidatus Desulfolinea nitratireducens]MBL6960518.1 4a-hydroxytetrahydrobiopterin dehydratase [Anaerolineales bacterium]
MKKLNEFSCVACHGDTPTLPSLEIAMLLPEVPDWQLIEVDGVQRLERSFSFKNFRNALEFTNRVGEEAEREGHHPRIITEWGSVKIQWWTYAINGLHKNDFIMAAKTDSL